MNANRTHLVLDSGKLVLQKSIASMAPAQPQQGVKNGLREEDWLASFCCSLRSERRWRREKIDRYSIERDWWSPLFYSSLSLSLSLSLTHTHTHTFTQGVTQALIRSLGTPIPGHWAKNMSDWNRNIKSLAQKYVHNFVRLLEWFFLKWRLRRLTCLAPTPLTNSLQLKNFHIDKINSTSTSMHIVCYLV